MANFSSANYQTFHLKEPKHILHLFKIIFSRWIICALFLCLEFHPHLLKSIFGPHVIPCKRLQLALPNFLHVINHYWVFIFLAFLTLLYVWEKEDPKIWSCPLPLNSVHYLRQMLLKNQLYNTVFRMDQPIDWLTD